METTFKSKLFFDTVQNKVDSKARVSVPAEYRDVLAMKNSALIAYRSFVYPCIECCPSAFMDMLVEKINNKFDLFSESHDDITRLILADAKAFSYDSTGRIVLSEKLIKHAKITTTALFVGMGEKFQIWSPEIYEEEENKLRERAKTARFNLNNNEAR